MKFTPIVTLLLASILTSPLTADAKEKISNGLAARISKCAQIAPQLERLRCFDALAGATRTDENIAAVKSEARGEVLIKEDANAKELGVAVAIATQPKEKQSTQEVPAQTIATKGSNVNRPRSDFDIELDKIKSNPDQVNWEILKLHFRKTKGRLVFDFNDWVKVPHDERIGQIENLMYNQAFDRAMLQHNGNRKLVDTLNLLGEGEDIKYVVTEFKNKYYDIYGTMPSLSFVNSDSIKARLLDQY